MKSSEVNRHGRPSANGPHRSQAGEMKLSFRGGRRWRLRQRRSTLPGDLLRLIRKRLLISAPRRRRADLRRFLRQQRSIDWEQISMRTGGNNLQLWRRTVGGWVGLERGGGGSEWMATLMRFPLPRNLCTSISRTISPPAPSVLMERFLFNCHIITIIIRPVNKRQGRRQTCHINQGITSAPISLRRKACWDGCRCSPPGRLNSSRSS